MQTQPSQGSLAQIFPSLRSILVASSLSLLVTCPVFAMPCIVPTLSNKVFNSGGNFARNRFSKAGQKSGPFSANLNVSFDLSAPAKIIRFSGEDIHACQSVTITEDRVSRILAYGNFVTAGEFIAASQAQSKTGQTILLDSHGIATGGTFSLGALSRLPFNKILIPHAVSAVDDVSTTGEIRLLCDLINYGSIRLISSSVVKNVRLVANNIVNQPSGLISFHTRSTLQTGGRAAEPNLILNATEKISNRGSIKAAQTLQLVSETGPVENTGLISSADGSICLSSKFSADVNINAYAGRFEAPNGDITVRDASYNGDKRIILNGGDYIARNLNLFAGGGDVVGRVGQVTADVKISGNCSHLLARTPSLHIGTNTISGDPTYVNTGGDIVIDGAVTASESMAMIASGNIYAAGDGYLKTGVATGSSDSAGRDVILIAGAKVSVGGPGASGVKEASVKASKHFALESSQFATVDGVSTTGGNIDFRDSKHDGAFIDTSSHVVAGDSDSINGGKIVLTAYAGGSGGGSIQLPSSVTDGLSIDARSEHGQGGSVTLIAGAANKNSDIGTILTAGATGVATLSLYGSQPASSDGKPIVFSNTGAITSGNFFNFSSSGGIPVLVGGVGMNTTNGFQINTTDAANLSIQSNGNVGIIEDTFKKPVTMEGGKVNRFFVGSAPGLSLTGDVTCEDSASIFGVSYFGTNGHKISSGYFELGGASFDCTDLTIGPDTNIVTTTPDHNGGNITIEPARGATVILNSGGSMTPAEGGSVIIRAYPGIHNGGIHVIAPSSGGAKETFNGQTIFEASSLNQSVRIDKNVELVCTNKLFINTPETVLNGTISCKETTYTYEPALSGGTIACSEGALDLSKLHSLTFTGQNLTILSASDITDAGASLAIDVSSFKGSGGKLNLIAGFDFVPHSSAGVEGNLDITTDYAISPIQRGAGAIKLSNTVINVSGAKASGGVFGYARGPILLKSITAIGNTQRQSFPSVAQSSGGVTLIGEGVTVERINTSGDNSAWSSRVSITSASPKTSGNVTVTAGLLAGGSFVPDIYQGSISPGAIGVDLGTVLLDASAADGSIVGGQIRSSRLVCKSGSGGIGTSADPVQLLSGNLVTANAGTAGDVYLNAESIWLLDENSGKDFFINTSAGAIEVGRNSRIFGQHSINLDSSGKFSMVKMQYGGALIEAPLLNLTTSGGAIGGAPAIRVKASRIRVTGPADRAQVHIVNLDPKGVLSFGVKPAKDGGKKLRHAEGVRRF